MSTLSEKNANIGFFRRLPWVDHVNTKQRNYGVAVADVDHDGEFEFIVAGFDGPNFVLKYNRSMQRLENIAKPNSPYEGLMDPGGRAIGVAVGDIDGDGKEEIYFLNTNNAYAGKSSYGDKLFKWRNGKYVDLYEDSINSGITAKGFAGRSVACIDRHGSGKYSFVIATYSDGGTGNFAMIEMNDANKDNDVSSGSIALHNTAKESGIEKATGGRGLVVGPILNNNGRSDILFGNEGNPWLRNPGANFLFRNNGDGTFTDVAGITKIKDEHENGRGITIGDFNRNGLIDVAYGNWEGPHRLFLHELNEDGNSEFKNVATSDFEEPTPIRTVITADFDNDGDTEIFMNNIFMGQNLQPNKLFRLKALANRKDVNISQLDIGDALESQGAGTGSAFADIDLDGVLELLVSHGENRGQPLELYKCETGKHNNWLRVLPKTKFGAPARGASVKIETTSGTQQMQVIDGGSGYLCQMEPFAHFGLGSDVVTKLIIQWPDGKVFEKALSATDMNRVHSVEYSKVKDEL